MNSEKSERKEFLFKAYVKEFDTEIEFAVDTGADVTCIPSSKVLECCGKEIRKSDKVILGPDGKKLPVVG